MGESVSDVGEIGLIARLLARLPQAGGVTIGPGDDAAVLDDGSVATADLLVEGRHFDLAFSSPSDVGFKSLAVNVSDLAAMGARPYFALVSIGAHPETPVAVLEALYDGLAEASNAFGAAIVGGDTVSSDVMIVSVA
ncbi:MAG TPA: thiamine-phosphate kinase, partial [Actinomycetota bacterium]|nr:thiamine-phosphate kinase [Actinomycetota bacterium]